jgi:hypothetical protein
MKCYPKNNYKPICIDLCIKILFTNIIFCCLTACAQKSDTNIHINEFGWTFKLPGDFQLIDTTKLSQLKKEGIKASEDVSKKPMNKSVVNLIAARKGQLNLFASNYYTSSDITIDNWTYSDSTLKLVWTTHLLKNVSGFVDSSNSIVNLDGVKFKKEQLNFLMDDKSYLRSAYLTTFYRNHFLVINYTFSDSAAGEEIIKMLNESKFEKQMK